jgi:hypothetical protein
MGMTEAELLNAKQLLAPGVLKIPGVSGLGIGDGCLHVYLTRDDVAVRQVVEEAVQASGQNAPLKFLVSGPFSAQSNR